MLAYSQRLWIMIVLASLIAVLVPWQPLPTSEAAAIIVPDDYPTIQAALDAAAPGDTITVRSGTYAEHIVIEKSVILTAETYDESDPTQNTTIIDGGGSDTNHVIRIEDGVSPAPTIRGFVIANGDDGLSSASDAVIEYNFFHSASDLIDTEEGGGGVIRHNVFLGADDDSIDLDDVNTPLTIEHNRLYDSNDDAIEIRLQPQSAPAAPIDVIIRNNEIVGANRDGIQLIDYNADPQDTNRIFTVTGNLFAHNKAGIGFMGDEETSEDLSGADIVETVYVYNNTFYNNDYALSGGDNHVAFNNIVVHGEVGASRVAGQPGDDSVVAYSLFFDLNENTVDSTLGAGNLMDVDPLFAYLPEPGPDGDWDTLDDDYAGLTLQPNSPALEAGIAQFETARGLLVPATPLSFEGAAPDLGWQPPPG